MLKTYIVSKEAWWAKANNIEHDELLISIYKGDDFSNGCWFEFKIDFKYPGARIVMFHDSWMGFIYLDDLFNRLAHMAKTSPDIKQVKLLLDSLGFIDDTNRENPEKIDSYQVCSKCGKKL